MSRTYYSMDRTPPGPVKLTAWTVLEARNEFVSVDPGHREAVTMKEAMGLCKDLHGVSLSVALERGLL